MKVSVLSPSGYCAGVSQAIQLAKKARTDYPNKNVYVLGMLVHNEQVVQSLSEKGIITLCDKNKTLLELIDDIPNGSVVIFTAHGHDRKLDDIALSKELIIYDAVCPKVKVNSSGIAKHIKEGYEVIYVGVHGHPETEASLSIGPNVHLFDVGSSFDYKLFINKKVYVANQTTLNYLELGKIHQEILLNIPNAIIENEICPSTRMRQEALMTLENDVDMIIIIGSNHSSNTKRLNEIAKMSHPDIPTIMVSSYEELPINECQNKNHIVLSSGASTPRETIDAIYDLLIKIK